MNRLQPTCFDRARATAPFALCVSIALLATSPVGAEGQEGAAGTTDRLATVETVTLEGALERALARSPQMARSEATLGGALASHRTATGSYFPRLSVGSGASLASTSRFDPNTQRVVAGSADSYSASLSASYALFDGGRRFSEADRTESEVEAARAGTTDQRAAVRLQTKNLFFAALEQEELLEASRARLRQAEENLTLVRRRAEVGTGTRSDTLRARLEFARARQQVLQAETGTRSARTSLGRQVGVAGAVAPVAPEEMEPEPLPLSDDAILRMAEEGSPAVRAAEASSSAARASVSSARAGYLPSLSLSSGYTWANQAAAFSGGNTSWSLRLSGSYPLFDGFDRSTSVDRAEDQARAARLEAENARLVAREEADGALQSLRTAEEALGIAREAVNVAEEDLRVVRERYRLGVATILELVTSQVAFDEARVDEVTARYDYVLARAQLEAVLGREL